MLTGAKAKAGERGARPEDVVRLYEALAANANELNELAAAVGGAQGEALMDDCAAKARGNRAQKGAPRPRVRRTAAAAGQGFHPAPPACPRPPSTAAGALPGRTLPLPGSRLPGRCKAA